jgi:hypothetical protein
MRLWVAQHIQSRMTAWLVNNEMERIWKEAVAVKVKVLSWNFPGKTEKNHEKTIMTSWPVGVQARSRIRHIPKYYYRLSHVSLLGWWRLTTKRHGRDSKHTQNGEAYTDINSAHSVGRTVARTDIIFCNTRWSPRGVNSCHVVTLTFPKFRISKRRSINGAGQTVAHWNGDTSVADLSPYT